MQNETMNNKMKENKMGTEPVNKLLLTMSLPMMISMLIQACYNIVDSMFVARLNENALTAVSMVFPIQSLMIAVSVGVGVGVNALLSKNLGEKRVDLANKASQNGIFIVAIGYVLFLVFGLFGAHAFMESQTGAIQSPADMKEIVDYGTSYLRICCTLSIGMFGQMILERLLQSTGKTFYIMITQGIGAIINIILDPIFIFGLLGVPKLGVAGAAIATVIGQSCAFVLALLFNIYKNHEISFDFKKFRPDGGVIRSILSVGVPSIIMQSIVSVMSLGMNKILVTFSSTAVAVFGVYFKLQSFIFMPVFGLNNGMIPILAYNFGAGNKSRMTKTIKLGILYAVCIMLAGLLVIQTIPETLFGIFSASPYMLEIGVPAIRIISLSFIFAGYCVVLSSVFQALGNGVYSMMISITRQLLVLLPTAYVFSKIWGLSMIWWAFPAAEIASVILCTLFIIRTNNKVLKNI